MNKKVGKTNSSKEKKVRKTNPSKKSSSPKDDDKKFAERKKKCKKFFGEKVNERVLEEMVNCDYDFFGENDSDDIFRKLLEDDDNENPFKTLRCFTLCFDIRRSTKLMAMSVNPKVYTSFMEDVVRESSKIIKRRNGLFDKFTGDGVLCHFLDFVDKENNYRNCLSSSVTLHHTFNMLHQDYIREQKFKLHLDDVGIGIGIDYGEVFFRVTKDQDNLLAIGESVNYACRLSDAPNDTTYLNTNAYHEVRRKRHHSLGHDSFKRKTIELKNDETIRVYELL